MGKIELSCVSIVRIPLVSDIVRQRKRIYEWTSDARVRRFSIFFINAGCSCSWVIAVKPTVSEFTSNGYIFQLNKMSYCEGDNLLYEKVLELSPLRVFINYYAARRCQRSASSNNGKHVLKSWRNTYSQCEVTPGCTHFRFATRRFHFQNINVFIRSMNFASGAGFPGNSYFSNATNTNIYRTKRWIVFALRVHRNSESSK
eukprot:GHVR01021563.1.p1 GENE.GHVR01021563.1~~GHVR01021563.1.p1  ORF type:complete len:201 (+),score=-19.68 GHVR01021563.1:219-821(+)